MPFGSSHCCCSIVVSCTSFCCALDLLYYLYSTTDKSRLLVYARHQGHVGSTACFRLSSKPAVQEELWVIGVAPCGDFQLANTPLYNSTMDDGRCLIRPSENRDGSSWNSVCESTEYLVNRIQLYDRRTFVYSSITFGTAVSTYV